MLANIGLTLGKVGLSLLMSLLTETFIKKALIAALEQLVKKTQSDLDDRLLAAAKMAWGESEPEKKP
jgi:hypothetical protein